MEANFCSACFLGNGTSILFTGKRSGLKLCISDINLYSQAALCLGSCWGHMGRLVLPWEANFQLSSLRFVNRCDTRLALTTNAPVLPCSIQMGNAALVAPGLGSRVLPISDAGSHVDFKNSSS